jgi:hypothetical protein
MANNSFLDSIQLAGRYFDDFGGLNYTTAAPATGPSGSLGASPEQSGFSFPEGVSPDKQAEIMNQQWQIERVLGQINKGSSPEEMERKFQMLDRLQAKQAERMMKYGTQSNIIGALLKDLPKAIAGPAWAKARYADLEAQSPLLAAQSIRPVFSNRDYVNL